MTTQPVPDSWKTHDKRVRPYVWSHRLIGWARSAVGIAYIGYLLFTPAVQSLYWWSRETVSYPFLSWLLFFAAVLGIWKLLSLPFGFAHYRVERKFGLSRQSAGAWAIDVVKGVGVGSVLGAFALGLFFLAVRFAGDAWWIAAWFLLSCFSVLLAQLAPVILIPIFLTLKPMADGELKQRLLSLCARFRIEVKDIYHLGLGEKTEKGNAAFTGLGRTKRILIGDTLYEKFSADEVEAVFAHELGHQMHNDIWKGIAVGVTGLFLAFWAATRIAEALVFPVFLTHIQESLGVFLFFLVLSAVQIPFGVLQALYSRSRERAADEFAFKTIGVGRALAEALEKLTFQNWGLFRPNPVVEFLTYSHPAPWRRIRRIRESA